MIRAGVIAVALVAAGAGVVSLRERPARHPNPAPAVPAPKAARTPAGARIRVEVLNATKVRGLARRATFHLRDAGFDVVASGNAPEAHERTLVIDRARHPQWAALVGRAMDGAEVIERPDSSHYVDVTVLVGASWRPPAKPFHP